MILHDAAIADALADGSLLDKVEGAPPEPEQVQPASLDLRLGPEVYDFAADRTYDCSDAGEVVFEPGTPYLGHTLDYIDLPNGVVGLLAGRSSVGRRFVIVHMTAGVVDPGFRGQLTMEVMNFSGVPQRFSVGERVAQLLFLRTEGESDGYRGKYQGQTGAMPAWREPR